MEDAENVCSWYSLSDSSTSRWKCIELTKWLRARDNVDKVVEQIPGEGTYSREEDSRTSNRPIQVKND